MTNCKCVNELNVGLVSLYGERLIEMLSTEYENEMLNIKLRKKRLLWLELLVILCFFHDQHSHFLPDISVNMIPHYFNLHLPTRT
jgi:hypothetical protein